MTIMRTCGFLCYIKPCYQYRFFQSIAMKPIIGAVVGGIIGAIIWAAITYFTGYEVGYVAWGIGAMIGFFSAYLGGEGMTNGLICAVMAALSIIAGKAIAIKITIDKEIAIVMEPIYQMYQTENQAYQKTSSEEEIRQFMVNNGYTENTSPAEIEDMEIQVFKSTTVPYYEKIENGMTLDEFNAEIIAEDEDLSIMKIIKEDLNIMDFLFFGLGVFTAFKIGEGLGEEDYA